MAPAGGAVPDLPVLCKRPGLTGPAASGCVPSLNLRKGMAMTIVEDKRAITGGVDTHADVHVAAALDPIGGLLGVQEFPATAPSLRCRRMRRSVSKVARTGASDILGLCQRIAGRSRAWSRSSETPSRRHPRAYAYLMRDTSASVLSVKHSLAGAQISAAGQAAFRSYPPRSGGPTHKTRPTGRLPGSAPVRSS
jgi:hypothetical protein